MKNVLNKDIIRDIKKSRGRFLSILCIVALGVSFFSGIKVSPLVMRKTSDLYYDEYNFMDIRLLSTLGLTDEDVKEISNIDGVKEIVPTYSIDVLTQSNSKEYVTRLHALQTDNNYINKVKVIEGRLPNKSGECVIEKSKINKIEEKIGDKIQLKSGSNDKLSDTLKSTEYTVVGFVETPYYLSFEKGSTSIGNGSVSMIAMIPEDDFKVDVYSDIFITVDDAKEENSYSDKYFNKVDKVTNKLDSISKTRIEARYNEVVDEANKELQKGKDEYENEKNEAYSEINKAENNIIKFSNKIALGEKILQDKKIELEKQLLQGKVEIEKANKEINKNYILYEEGLSKFNQEKVNSQNKIEEAEIKLNDLKIQINVLQEQIIDLEEKISNGNILEEEKENILNEVNSKKQNLALSEEMYSKGSYQLSQNKEELNKAEESLILMKSSLDEARSKLNIEKLNLESMEEKSKFELKKVEDNIKYQKEKIEKAKQELEENKLKAEDELSKAEKKLKDAEDDINKIEKPEWYILDRNSHYSYAEYLSCANSVDAIAKIFPIFFFSVAALVCLTTMTRMVDEQRINIGTLKALGYSTKNIAKKYILYALIASLLGSIIGLAIGFTVFPIVVFNAYGLMFTLPKIELLFSIPLALGVTLMAVGITTLSSYFACNKELKESPSNLMRPKSPKEGKRILLERIPFIWSKIGFIGKVTIRNILRYKKRFLMTVLGISGCTALILTGFGIKDSIQMIVDGQYGSIFKYDMTVTIDNNSTLSSIKSIDKAISEDKEIDSYQFMNNQNGKLVNDKVEKSVNIVTPDNVHDMDKFIRLKNRKNQDKIKLTNDGIVITEKAAKDLGVIVGDTVELINYNDRKASVKVIGITENYVSHYVYISRDYYKNLFHRDVNYNRVVGIVKDKSEKAENILSNKLTKNSNITGVSFNTGVKNNFKNTIKSLNYVVLIMIISAGALAFVVLYNLTNVNISERIREIATIKVLGFYDKEVSAYIYRENIILTVIGTLVGLILGQILHQFIMITVELESMMFGRTIQIYSYIVAAGLTIILGFVVNIAMYYKLKNVKMVESLKSVD